MIRHFSTILNVAAFLFLLIGFFVAAPYLVIAVLVWQTDANLISDSMQTQLPLLNFTNYSLAISGLLLMFVGTMIFLMKGKISRALANFYR